MNNATLLSHSSSVDTILFTSTITYHVNNFGEKKNWEKLRILSLSLTSYFNCVNLILTFQCRVNLVYVIISWMKIADMANGQKKKKKKAYCHININ